MLKFISKDTNEENVTTEYIEKLEEKWNIKFPPILVEYYLYHNAAEVYEFSFFRHGIEFSIEFILPLKFGKFSVEHIYDLNQSDEFISDRFIPLAEDTSGEEYYWDSKNGKVYYLSMENVENPIPISNSVEEFFELLNTAYERSLRK